MISEYYLAQRSTLVRFCRRSSWAPISAAVDMTF
jgi:hypothetical protein